jgi:hypothetical protein
MISGLDDVLVDIVAFESMVNLHPGTQVGVFFFCGYRGLPALPSWEDRSSFLDLAQE